MKILVIVAVVIVCLAAALLWMAGGWQSARTFEETPLAFGQNRTGAPEPTPPEREPEHRPLPEHAHQEQASENRGIPVPTPQERASQDRAIPEREPQERASNEPSSRTLTVVSWNIAWGYGWGSEGRGQRKPRAHFEAALAEMASFLRSVRPDLVLLQEIDFDSRRSGRMDQLAALAEGLGLPFGARALSWRAGWVPFPYWPPSEHFGHMRSGGAILSRYPIRRNEVFLLPKPSANPFWYNLFYLFRYLQRAEIEVEMEGSTVSVAVFNTHLEAFDGPNRESQARQIADVLAQAAHPWTIFGGDLNSVPPEAAVRSGYPDEPKTNHELDDTVAILRSAGLVDPRPTRRTPGREGTEPGFTFPSHDPNRTLDYVMLGPGFRVLEARVATEATTTSDHLPVVVRVEVLAPDS